MSKQTKDFVPQLLEENGSLLYGTILILLHRCAHCQRPMIFGAYRTSLPTNIHTAMEAQLRRADWGIESSALKGGKPICVDCQKQGAASFICAACKAERKSNELQITIGSDYPDQLCMVCYETMPAAQWDKLVERLEEEHQYDNC